MPQTIEIVGENEMSGDQFAVENIVFEKKFVVTDEDIDRLLKTFQLLNLRNVWSKVTDKNDFISKRFELGYVNDIVCCELTADAKQKFSQQFDDFPSLVVKYQVKQSFFEIDPLESALIQVCSADHKLSPRVFYIDEDCQISEYIEGRNYNQEDDFDESLVRKLARRLAKFHSLDPPISKKGYESWLVKTDFEATENEVLFSNFYLTKLDTVPELKQKYYDSLSKFDFEKEWTFVNNLKKSIESPLVFSHNDFNRGNRLIKFESDAQTKKTIKEIYFIDLDYSNINNRGYDLGRYFSNYQHKEDLFGDEGFPSDEEMDVFLEEYRQKIATIQGFKYLESTMNSLKQLRLESKVYTLLAYYIDSGFGKILTLQAAAEIFELDKSLKIVKARFEGYLKLKHRFIEDGTISQDFLNKQLEKF